MQTETDARIRQPKWQQTAQADKARRQTEWEKPLAERQGEIKPPQSANRQAQGIKYGADAAHERAQVERREAAAPPRRQAEPAWRDRPTERFVRPKRQAQDGESEEARPKARAEETPPVGQGEARPDRTERQAQRRAQSMQDGPIAASDAAEPKKPALKRQSDAPPERPQKRHEPKQAEAPTDEPIGQAESAEGDGKAQPAKAKKKRKRMHPLVAFLIKLALTAVIVWSVFTFVLGVHIHHGNRMYPFLMDGDLLITYKLDPYHIGDVVAFPNPETGETMISRIVAKDGDEVMLSESGDLLINGALTSETVYRRTDPFDGGVTLPYRVGSSGFFVLNDFRTDGPDSRSFGEIREEAVLGKVVYVFRRRGI